MVDPQTWKAMHVSPSAGTVSPEQHLRAEGAVSVAAEAFRGVFREQFRMLGDVRVGLFNAGQALTAIPVALGLFGVAANYVRERKVWVLNASNLFDQLTRIDHVPELQRERGARPRLLLRSAPSTSSRSSSASGRPPFSWRRRSGRRGRGKTPPVTRCRSARSACCSRFSPPTTTGSPMTGPGTTFRGTTDSTCWPVSNPTRSSSHTETTTPIRSGTSRMSNATAPTCGSPT